LRPPMTVPITAISTLNTALAVRNRREAQQ
jgi:hypothetical protein